MNTRKTLTTVLGVLLAALLWSCNESEPPVTIAPDQQNIVADNLIANSNSALSRLRGQGIGGPMGAIFGNFSSGLRGRSLDISPSQMMRGAMQDTTDTEPTCFVETWEDDGAGNYTFTLDFGVGCDFYGEFLKGKLVEKGSYSETGFSSEATYTNFGGHDWTIDGTQSYSGTWSATDDWEGDSTNFAYSASYEFSSDIMTSYMEYGYDTTSEASTGERLVEVTYVAQGAEEMDQDGWTVKTRTESIELGTGEAFASQVTIPLYYDYSCDAEGVWIYVSGEETGSYTYENISGTYSINYGEGECDNIVTVTENGVSEDVDLGEAWEEWEGECGNS